MIKVLRSLIHEYLPLDLRFKIELLSRRRDISNKEKQDELLELLRSFKLENFVQLGPGTNRYAFKLNGFVIKIATDNDGKIDNFKEFKMAKRLFPYVTKTYEVSENGTILVAEYIQPFISYGEMQAHGDQIREILDKLSKVYLIGDVGITSKNFSNWGTRIGTDIPVCLDFAYVYDVSSNLFICNKCGTNSMLIPDKNYTKLICSNAGCRAEFTFEDIRRKIGNDLHMHEIGDLSEEAYLLESSNVKTQLNPERSRYLMRDKSERKRIQEQEVVEEVTPDTFVMEHEPAYYINKQNSEETNMDGNLIVEARVYGEQFVKPGKPVKVVATPVKEHGCGYIKDELRYDKNEPIEVIARPVKSNTALAFECEMDPNNTIENIIGNSAIKATKIERKNARDNNEQSKDGGNCMKAHQFVPQFVNNMHRAISKLSNKISDDLYNRELYDLIRPDLTSTENFYTGDFYKIVQNAIFRSITIFLDMEEGDEFNPRTNKTYTVYKAPININNSKYFAMLKFIERFWLNRDINDLDGVNEIMGLYKKLYPDYQGLDRNWLPTFTARLASNLTIADKFTIQKIVDFVANDWCDNSTPVVNEPKLDDNNFDDMTFNIPNIKNLTEVPVIRNEEKPLVPEITNIRNNEEEDNEEDSSLISVEIYPGIKTDCVKLKYSDDAGANVLPFYCKLAEYSTKDLGELISHPLSGVWNWLAYINPDYVFETTRPEYWLSRNVNTSEDFKYYKYAIIDERNDSYVMGLYCLEGIYINNSNDELDLTEDPELLKRINNLFTLTLSKSTLNSKEIVLSNYDIHTEKELCEFLEEEFEEENNESIDDSNNEDDSEEFDEMAPKLSDIMPLADIPDDSTPSSEESNLLTPIRRK